MYYVYSTIKIKCLISLVLNLRKKRFADNVNRKCRFQMWIHEYSTVYSACSEDVRCKIHGSVRYSCKCQDGKCDLQMQRIVFSYRLHLVVVSFNASIGFSEQRAWHFLHLCVCFCCSYEISRGGSVIEFKDISLKS